jgi:membrane protease YdiL (CAAX protease family)
VEAEVNETLRSSDRRFIAACIALCVVALIVGIFFFHRAFPEASIDFRVNRDTSLPVAERFLASRHLSLGEYRHASAFRYDDDAKVFLERELGLGRANVLVRKEIKLWRWSHRWFKPTQKEELRADISTGGELAFFDHIIPEEAPGANLPEPEARAQAVSFLEQVIRRPIDTLEFVESQSQKRPHRTDHVFTWKVRGLALLDEHDASYRISVTVHGDRVDGYSEYLKVPEKWQRDYARLRSLNTSASTVDALFFLLLGVAMLVALGRSVRLQDVRWKTALVFGAVAFVLQFLASLNEFPLDLYNFDTTGTYSSFMSRLLLQALLVALGSGGVILLLTACAEPVYRAAYPRQLSISRMFGWSAIRTRSFFLAALAGITLTFFFFAYEIGFYLLANRLGAWAPADIPYSELLNTRFPWVFVLFMGFFPAVSEEWVFRAFSIPYLQKLFRYRWLAIVLASFIWGFGHSAYPNQPFFIRGIEVGIVGLVMSWAMLRFGILAPLIAHYSIDAFFTAFLLLRSGDTYLAASGAVTAGINLFPLLLAVGAYIATRRFHRESTSTNESEGSPSPLPAAPAREEEREVAGYSPLGRVRVVAALLILGLGIALLALRAPGFGQSVDFRVSRSDAVELAGKYLSRLGFDLKGYRAAVLPEDRSDPLAVQYIYTAAGIRGLNTAYIRGVEPLSWQARFYKPLHKEEFRVDINPDNGKAVAFRHLLPEDAPGADLDQARTLAIAQSFLRTQKYDLSRWELVETRSEKRKERRDTDFTWEAKPGTAGVIDESRARIDISVLGDRVGSWYSFFKIPEDWRRAREQRTWFYLAVLGARILLIVSLLTAAVIALIRGVRQGTVQWGFAVRIAALYVGFQFVNVLNSLPQIMFRYDTQISPQVFGIVTLVSIAAAIVGSGLAALLATGLVLACYPDVPSILRPRNLARWRRDVFFAAAAGLGVNLVLRSVSGWMHYAGSRYALAPSLYIPPDLGSYVPLLSGMNDVFTGALFISVGISFAIYLWTRLARALWMRLGISAALLISILPASAKRLSEVALGAIPTLLLLGAVLLLVVLFIRDNYAAYFIVPAFVGAWMIAWSWLFQGNLALTVQGLLLLLLVLGAAIALLMRAGPAAKLQQ